MIEFKMPALGSDMDEGTLNEWLVKPGDPVTRGQVVAVVETTKAAVEVECWHEGTIHELLVPSRRNRPSGDTIGDAIDDRRSDRSTTEEADQTNQSTRGRRAGKGGPEAGSGRGLNARPTSPSVGFSCRAPPRRVAGN